MASRPVSMIPSDSTTVDDTPMGLDDTPTTSLRRPEGIRWGKIGVKERHSYDTPRGSDGARWGQMGVKKRHPYDIPTTQDVARTPDLTRGGCHLRNIC